MKYDATRNIRKSHALACARHGSYCVIRTTHDTAILQGMTAMMVWEGSATVAGTHGPDISVIDAIDFDGDGSWVVGVIDDDTIELCPLTRDEILRVSDHITYCMQYFI